MAKVSQCIRDNKEKDSLVGIQVKARKEKKGLLKKNKAQVTVKYEEAS